MKGVCWKENVGWYDEGGKIRAVHGSSWIDFRPNPNLTHQRRVEGRGTWNRSLALISWVSFEFRWCSSQFSRWRTSLEAANVTRICKKMVEICKTIFEICKNSPDLHRNHQNIHQNYRESVGIWPDLAKSHKYGWDLAGSPWIWAWSSRSWPDLYITFVESGGSSFGEENPPLDPPASSLGCIS